MSGNCSTHTDTFFSVVTFSLSECIGYARYDLIQSLHYARDIWKHSFISTVSRKRTFSNELLKPEEFENALFSFSCGRKTFGKESFVETQIQNNKILLRL